MTRRLTSLLVILCFSIPVFGQNPFETLRTLHVVVKYQKGVPELDARQAGEYLENEHKYLKEKLGLELSQPLELRMYSSVGSYMSQAKIKKPWRGGIYTEGVLHLQPVEGLLKKNILEETLSYEFATAMLEQAGRNGCPLWLRESFAVSHSGEMTRLTPPYGILVTYFSDVDQLIQESPNPPQRDDIHFILGHTMKFVVDRFGEARAFGVFKAFDGLTGVNDVFSKHFKQDFATVEKAWSDYISSVTQKLKK